MTAITTDVILIPLKGNGTVASYHYLYNSNLLGYYDISFADATNIQSILIDNIDSLIDRLGSVD